MANTEFSKIMGGLSFPVLFDSLQLSCQKFPSCMGCRFRVLRAAKKLELECTSGPQLHAWFIS